jgi:hypothetical protein
MTGLGLVDVEERGTSRYRVRDGRSRREIPGRKIESKQTIIVLQLSHHKHSIAVARAY